MRIHVTAKGKATSISVDDTLMDYLGAHFVLERPRYHTDAQYQLKLAKKRVQEFVRSAKVLPDKDLSQYVQAVLLENIVSQELKAIVKARGPRFVAPKGAKTSADADPAERERLMSEIRRAIGRSA